MERWKERFLKISHLTLKTHASLHGKPLYISLLYDLKIMYKVGVSYTSLPNRAPGTID